MAERCDLNSNHRDRQHHEQESNRSGTMDELQNNLACRDWCDLLAGPFGIDPGESFRRRLGEELAVGGGKIPDCKRCIMPASPRLCIGKKVRLKKTNDIQK